ncbi:MAG: glycosyltransferase family 1 protein [Bacteroidota bacterium]|nr:glycosyltransferase family 1 protein [Bacteroidota bacterium]
MRIGFDAKRFFHNKTGLGNYSRDLIRILNHFYPQNTYLLYNPKKTNQYQQLTSSDTIVERNPEGGWKKLKSLWRTFGVSSQLKADKIDIYHGLSGEIPLHIPQGVKKVVTIHDLIFVRYPHLYSFLDRKIYFQKFKKAAQDADVVVAISKQTKRDIIDFLKIDSNKIQVIYQGCSDVFKKTYTSAELEKTRKKFSLPERFILNVGTLEERKNALNIVKAIKEVNTSLVLVGKKTSYYQKIEEYIGNHQMQDKVLCLSEVNMEELAMIYQMADVFVYPSVFEGFGIPIIEALYSKTPVITTGSGVFPEAGGKDSIYVNPQDVLELKNAICQLIDNPKLRGVIAQKGFEFVQRFNDDVIAQKYNLLYEKLLQR